MLGVGAEVFALFLAVGPGRRQVFNEYFHSSPAVWRDSAAAGGVERGWRAGGGGGRRARSGARKGVARRGGVKGSAGEGRTSGASRGHMAPAEGA